MKVAIIHDWLVNWGGAENVLASINSLYPEADIFTVINFLSEENRKRLPAKNIYTSEVQNYPFAKKLYRLYLSKMPQAMEKLDLSKYDLIISSSHSVAKGVISLPHQLHICYIYTPMRYAWDMKTEYLNSSPLFKFPPLKKYMEMVLFNMRNWDVRNSNQVDFFIAGSNFAKNRVKKYYKREATVIPSPVNTTIFAYNPAILKEDFYLAAARLVPYKNIDTIVEAFNKMPNKKLVVAGTGTDFEKLKKMAGANVQFLGFLRPKDLCSYMQRAKGFIIACKEDFGLAPLEAQACGTPVLAYKAGGNLETVLAPEENPATYTGLFFEEQTVASITAGILNFEKIKFNPENCRKNAEKYSEESFKKAIKTLIEEKYSTFAKK